MRRPGAHRPRATCLGDPPVAGCSDGCPAGAAATAGHQAHQSFPGPRFEYFIHIIAIVRIILPKMPFVSGNQESPTAEPADTSTGLLIRTMDMSETLDAPQASLDDYS